MEFLPFKPLPFLYEVEDTLDPDLVKYDGKFYRVTTGEEVEVQYSGVGDGAHANNAGFSGYSGYSGAASTVTDYVKYYFGTICWFFGKSFLYLHQKYYYAKLRILYKFKPASKQYLPRCAI